MTNNTHPAIKAANECLTYAERLCLQLAPREALEEVQSAMTALRALEGCVVLDGNYIKDILESAERLKLNPIETKALLGEYVLNAAQMKGE